MLEAMAVGLPVLASDRGYGRLLPVDDQRAWTAALAEPVG